MPDQPEWLYFTIAVTCKHYHATNCEDFATELTQFFYYTVGFNIILTINQAITQASTNWDKSSGKLYLDKNSQAVKKVRPCLKMAGIKKVVKSKLVAKKWL